MKGDFFVEKGLKRDAKKGEMDIGSVTFPPPSLLKRAVYKFMLCVII